MLRAATICLLLAGSVSAYAADCPGNPDAIGTSRTIVVDPAEHGRIGSFQYPETLPLADKEVVLTLDDSPRPIYTEKVLDTLAAHCVKATYFLIGNHAKEFPKVVQRIAAEGHTIGTHSMKHPLTFPRMSAERVRKEVEDGIAAVDAALGESGKTAPFFRIPGLLRSDAADNLITSKGLMVWSTDVMAQDWKRRINEAGIVRRALDRLAAKGKGILLLHDIHPKTAAALPVLLSELKARGYRIVHVVPASPERPKTQTEPEAWVFRAPEKPPLPVLLMADVKQLNQNLSEQVQMSGVDSCGEKAGTRSRRFASRAAWHKRHRLAKAAPARLAAKATPAPLRREAAVTTARTD
jgi:peptidoglycan/xylan/chitin deacetylase (PgdA/CDA1 family)